jgi:hypothetical protein
MNRLGRQPSTAVADAPGEVAAVIHRFSSAMESDRNWQD